MREKWEQWIQWAVKRRWLLFDPEKLVLKAFDGRLTPNQVYDRYQVWWQFILDETLDAIKAAAASGFESPDLNKKLGWWLARDLHELWKADKDQFNNRMEELQRVALERFHMRQPARAERVN